MIVAVLDISKNNIGLIIKNSETSIYQLPIFYKCIQVNFIETLKIIYKKYKPELTIVGLSKHKDGKLLMNGHYTKNFVHKNRLLFVPFVYINEYNTTKNTIENIFDLNINILSALSIFQKWQILNTLTMIY